ncbi:MAG: hypothetical protein RI907_824 [Pseudomonadota bacterium]|jgi:hypothetical protein
MTCPSWRHLRAEEDSCPLPPDLRAADAMDARDCGWVAQMQPYIASHAQAERWVLDPFCGFGSTLVAAWQGGARAVGVELSAPRAALATERLRRLGMGPERHPVLTGSLADPALVEALRAQLGAGPQPIGLCLTNIPYFGCHTAPGGEGSGQQLYLTPHYEPFLQGLREVFLGVHSLLAPDGWCVVMAQNLRLGDTLVPLAWDVARLLSDRYTLQDERVIVYDRAHTEADGPGVVGNRAHESVLVFQKARPPIDTAEALALLSALLAEGFELALHGSLARQLAGLPGAPAHDIDLLVPPGDEALSRLLQALQARGFSLASWGAGLTPPVTWAALGHRHYFRAQRVNALGRRLQVDVAVDTGWAAGGASAEAVHFDLPPDGTLRLRLPG